MAHVGPVFTWTCTKSQSHQKKACLIIGRGRAFTQKHEWCSNVSCIIPFYCRKLAEMQKIRRPTKMHISGICQRLWPISWWIFEPSLRGTLNNRPQHKPPGPSSSPQAPKSLESHPNLLLLMKSGQIGQPSTNYWQKSQAQLYWDSLASLAL